MNFLEEMRKRVAAESHGVQRRMAEATGITEDQIGRILSGKRQLRVSEIPLIANFLGIEGYTGERKTIPVVGIVGAGAEIFPFDAGEFDEVEAPPGVSDEAHALIVRGESMIPAYYDGDIVIYDRPLPWNEATRYVGEECVVETGDGRRALKILLPGRDVRTWTLHSYNAEPIVDVLLDWAAHVVWTKRAPRKVKRLTPSDVEKSTEKQSTRKKSRK